MRYVYSWRNTFAADAEEAVEKFWKERPDYDTPQLRADYVNHALGLNTNERVLPFIWKNITIHKGDGHIIVGTFLHVTVTRYQSFPPVSQRGIPVVLRPVAIRLTSQTTLGSPTRWRETPRTTIQCIGPVCCRGELLSLFLNTRSNLILALQAERALTFWKTGNYKKPDNRTAMCFSQANWGSATDAYMKSLLKTKDKNWDAIVEEAEGMLDALNVKLAWSDRSATTVESPDVRAMCVEAEMSEEEL